MFIDRFLCPNPLIFNRLPHLRNKKKEEKHLNAMNSKQRNEKYLIKWRITDKVPPSASEKWNDSYVKSEMIHMFTWTVQCGQLTFCMFSLAKLWCILITQAPTKFHLAPIYWYRWFISIHFTNLFWRLLYLIFKLTMSQIDPLQKMA